MNQSDAIDGGWAVGPLQFLALVCVLERLMVGGHAAVDQLHLLPSSSA